MPFIQAPLTELPHAQKTAPVPVAKRALKFGFCPIELQYSTGVLPYGALKFRAPKQPPSFSAKSSMQYAPVGPQVLELADPPRNFVRITRNPGPDFHNEPPIITAPKMYFQRLRGWKSSYVKVGICSKISTKNHRMRYQGTPNHPMKETLLPCTQGLVNTGVPFGLDLPHGPQNHKKTSKFDAFSFFWFLGRKTQCTRILFSGCGCVL